MSSPFVAVPPSPPVGSPDLVQNDGWFPDVDLTLIRANARIDTTVTVERLREATVAAIIEINQDLADWRGAHESAGIGGLDAVPSVQIGGESRLVGLYRRAVGQLASADLSDRLSDIGATAGGHDRADELSVAADLRRRAARYAVADIIGRPRTTVELI